MSVDAAEIKTSEELLSSIPMFAGLPERAIEQLAKTVRTVPFSRKSVICRQGDAGDSLFIVKAGQIEICVPEGDEHETRLATLKPGEFFGELALLDGQQRSATARADVDSRLLILHREPFFTVLREPNVVENLVAVLAKRVREADQLVATRGIDNRKLEEEALTDALTGLGNRRKLRRDLENLEARAQRYGQGFSLAMCDIDNFKRYNDTYGHAKGDDVLRAVARRMAQQARSGDEVYRYGGEEFTVVFPSQSDRHAAIGMERIRKGVEQLAIPHVGNVPWGFVTFSSGLAAAEAGQQSMDEILQRADAALYRAKEHGRNRVEQADADPSTNGQAPTEGAARG